MDGNAPEVGPPERLRLRAPLRHEQQRQQLVVGQGCCQIGLGVEERGEDGFVGARLLHVQAAGQGHSQHGPARLDGLPRHEPAALRLADRGHVHLLVSGVDEMACCPSAVTAHTRAYDLSVKPSHTLLSTPPCSRNHDSSAANISFDCCCPDAAPLPALAGAAIACGSSFILLLLAVRTTYLLPAQSERPAAAHLIVR